MNVEYEEKNPSPTCCDIYELFDFIESCKMGGFMDSDGFGNPSDRQNMNSEIIIKLSKCHLIPTNCKYVVWFNR